MKDKGKQSLPHFNMFFTILDFNIQGLTLDSDISVSNYYQEIIFVFFETSWYEKFKFQNRVINSNSV